MRYYAELIDTWNPCIVEVTDKTARNELLSLANPVYFESNDLWTSGNSALAVHMSIVRQTWSEDDVC